jgi:hypothetical protein
MVAENHQRDPETDWRVSLEGSASSLPIFEIRTLTEQSPSGFSAAAKSPVAIFRRTGLATVKDPSE